MAQINENTACVLLDIDYSGTVLMYNTLNEDTAIKLQYNFEEEDFITFNILAKNDTMYYVEANFEIDGFVGKGWIMRNEYMKIYARNYTQNLNLYTQPSKKSSVQCVIKEYSPELYDVLDCDGTWLKVRIYLNGEKFDGWLSPDMQCCNPYSTCG